MDENEVERLQRQVQLLHAAEEPHRLAVLSACEAIGYGRVMQIASEAWREQDPSGALRVGPCYGAKPEK